MAEVIYKVQAPDGSILKIAGPEGASEDEIQAFAAQAYAGKSSGEGKQADRLLILQTEYANAVKQMKIAENIADSTPTEANVKAYERLSRDVSSLRSEITRLAGEDGIPDVSETPAPAAAAASAPGSAASPDLQAQKARVALDVLGAGAGAAAAKTLNFGQNVAQTAQAVRELPALLRSGAVQAPTAPSATPSMAPSTPTMAPAAGGPAGPVGGPATTGALPYAKATGPGSAVQNYATVHGLPEIEAAKALGTGKGEGEVWDLLEKRRQAMNQIQQMGGGYAENPRYGGIMTPEPSVGSGPRASYVQQPAIPASPDVPGGKPAALAQLPKSQPIPNTPIQAAAPQGPGALSRAAGAVQRGAGAVLRSPTVTGGLGGLAATENAQQAQQRYAQGDTTGAMVSGAGSAGGALMMAPNMKAKALGAFLATASPLTNYLRDKFSPLKPRIPEPGTNMPPVEMIPR